jgi:hypothetical protein
VSKKQGFYESMGLQNLNYTDVPNGFFVHLFLQNYFVLTCTFCRLILSLFEILIDSIDRGMYNGQTQAAQGLYRKAGREKPVCKSAGGFGLQESL